jgi:hypothetical protein
VPGLVHSLHSIDFSLSHPACICVQRSVLLSQLRTRSQFLPDSLGDIIHSVYNGSMERQRWDPKGAGDSVDNEMLGRDEDMVITAQDNRRGGKNADLDGEMDSNAMESETSRDGFEGRRSSRISSCSGMMDSIPWHELNMEEMQEMLMEELLREMEEDKERNLALQAEYESSEELDSQDEYYSQLMREQDL